MKGKEREPSDERTREVRRRVERMAEARRRADTFWRHVLNVGTLGWVFILPVVLGAVLGRLGARLWGIKALGVIGLLVGVAAGAYGVYRQVQKSLEEDSEERPRGDDGKEGRG